MVKKIKGTGGSGGSKIGATTSIGTSKIDTVKGVSKAGRTEKLAGTRARTRVMTSAEREYLFELVREEADKLFGNTPGLPNSKREEVENAVKMAIDAGIIDEAEED